MSTYLVYLNSAQKIDTVEHGMVRGLTIANPASCETRALARDYLEIAEGDEIIACSSDGVRWKASIEEIVSGTCSAETEEEGAPVRILKGKLTARGSRSLAATCKRMKDNGITLPDIINTRGSGFKQGALAKKLTSEQEAEFDTGLQ